MHAIQFLFNFVTDEPGNWIPPNRGVGWISFMVGELWRNLADRELAEAVKARWIAVYEQLIVPQMNNGQWWSWKRDDRIGPGIRAIPWQAAVFALGLDWAGEALAYEPARGFARAIGPEIIDAAYIQQGGRWTSRDVITQDGSDPGPYLGAYDFFGMPMAVAATLRHHPEHAVARAIWTQLKQEATTWGQASWLAPGITP
jgi:hypothetical protein